MLGLGVRHDLLGLLVDLLPVESDMVIEVVIDLNSPHTHLINNNF